MKVLIVGTGGVGESMAAIAKRRDPNKGWLEKMVMADYDLAKAQAISKRLGEDRFPAEKVDASNPDEVAALATKHGVDIICNLVAPEFNPQLLQAALKAKTHYLDTAMTVSEPHPEGLIGPTGVMLGDKEFPLSPEFDKIGKVAFAGFGVEPGMADYFARYAADHLFDEIEEIGIRDGSNLEIPGAKGISFGFSIWTTIEECTQPAIVWEKGKGWYTIEPFAELEPFFLPEGIGTVEIAHVEHEEVVNLGRSAHLLKGNKKATFKYALGDDFMNAIDIFKSTNMDKKTPIKVKGVEVAPRDVIAAAAPDPNEIGKRYVGQTAAGTSVRGKKTAWSARPISIRSPTTPSVSASTAPRSSPPRPPSPRSSPSSSIATGKLIGQNGNPESGVHVPEEFNADDFVALMPAYEFPGGLLEMDAEYKRHQDRQSLVSAAKALAAAAR